MEPIHPEAVQAYAQSRGTWLRPAIGACLLLFAVSLGISAYLFTQYRADARAFKLRMLDGEARVSALSKSLEELKREVTYMQEARAEEVRNGRVDLTESHFQIVDEGFSVGKLEVARHLSGVKVSGIILNTTSVTHGQLTMKVVIVGREVGRYALLHEKEFSVNRVGSGSAAKFSVNVPDVKGEDARFAEFKYVRSTVSYYSQ